MNISYDYYKFFYYVAKYGSFTRAAQMLLSNQPNVTRAIKAMEAELGCTLFERNNRGARLTPEGEALYAHISLAFEHIQAAEEEFALNRSLQRGIVTIGTTETALRCYLLPILNEYRRTFPNIKLKISNLSTPQAVSALQNGLVDFAVVTTPVECGADISVRAVGEFGDVCICGEAYRAALTGRPVNLKALTEYPLISLSKGRSTHAFYSDIFAKLNLTFSPDVEVATVDQIIPLVKHGLGIGFVPAPLLEEEHAGIFTVDVSDSVPRRSICVATLKSRSQSLPAKGLKEMLV